MPEPREHRVIPVQSWTDHHRPGCRPQGHEVIEAEGGPQANVEPFGSEDAGPFLQGITAALLKQQNMLATGLQQASCSDT